MVEVEKDVSDFKDFDEDSPSRQTKNMLQLVNQFTNVFSETIEGHSGKNLPLKMCYLPGEKWGLKESAFL